LVRDVGRHIEENGPWRYKFSQLYSAPEDTAAVDSLAAAARFKVAA
jgi:hypothetical protein